MSRLASDPDYAAQLATERDAVLAGPQFRQSASLVRLLEYLVDRAIRDPASKVTQYDIAVDAMGKSDAFDLGNESYARVLVSRLRKGLAQHYAMTAAAGETCLHVPKGSYSIALGPFEEAYPEPGPNRNPDLADENSDPAGTTPAGWSGIWSTAAACPKWLLVCMAVLLLSCVVGAAAIMSGWGKRASFAESPMVRVSVQGPAGSGRAESAQAAASLARSLISSSLVGRLAPDGEADYADYEVEIDHSARGQQDADEIVIILRDHNANVVSSAAFRMDPADPATLDRVKAYLIDLFRPSGILTDAVLGRIDSAQPRSAYECFIAIDTNRAITVDPAMVENCVGKYGDDRIHLPNAIARNAFSLYVEDLQTGGEIASRGPAWIEAQRAQSHGWSSLYTNVLIARVDFAEDRCERGLHRMDRFAQRMEVFPSLRAMLLTDGFPCMADPATQLAAQAELRKLVSYNIDAAPILRAYLVLASIETGDIASARKLLEERRREANLDRSLAELYTVLDDALLHDRPVEPDRQAAIIRVFVWNPDARTAIVRTLSHRPMLAA